MAPFRDDFLGKLWFAATMTIVFLAIGILLIALGLVALLTGDWSGARPFVGFFVMVTVVGAAFALIGLFYLRLWVRIARIRAGMRLVGTSAHVIN